MTVFCEINEQVFSNIMSDRTAILRDERDSLQYSECFALESLDGSSRKLVLEKCSFHFVLDGNIFDGDAGSPRPPPRGARG